MSTNDERAGTQAYEAYLTALRAHDALVSDPHSAFADRLAAAVEVGNKFRAAQIALGGREPVDSDVRRGRDQLHEAAYVALAMIRGIIEIGGFDHSTGEDANLCSHLLYEAERRLRDAVATVSR